MKAVELPGSEMKGMVKEIFESNDGIAFIIIQTVVSRGIVSGTGSLLCHLFGYLEETNAL